MRALLGSEPTLPLPIYRYACGHVGVSAIAGGPSLEADDKLGVLTPVWDEEPRLRPGVTIERYDWISTIDSLRVRAVAAGRVSGRF